MSDLFDWADMVRSTDGVTAHEAAALAAKRRGEDRQLIWALWNQMIEGNLYYPTRKILEYDYLPTLGYDEIRSQSLRRRLSDLVVRPLNQESLWLLCWTGERVDKSEVLTYTERGRMVLVEPGLMAGLWNLKKKKAKPKTPPEEPTDISFDDP
jgi:hypothetical protein